ncbi:hypothetical protein XENOCAPTIV_006413, partial [Xenoophorus captivus]
VDESDCLSMASSHNQETERFLSTGPTGRRVSFNEAALFDHGKKTQEKGRRSDSQHIHRAKHLQICSPKRRQFQRQRAASESMDQDDNTHHIDLIQYIAGTQDVPYYQSQPTTRLLSPPSTPPPSLGRVEVEVVVEPSCSHAGPGVIGLSPDPQEESLSVMRRESGYSIDSFQPQDPQSLYRDIWTLRASLEQYAASDQSSNNDRNSVYSDADSVCSLGLRTDAERVGLPSYPSLDLGDEAEGGEENKDLFAYPDDKLGIQESRQRKQGSTESEGRGSDGESGTRKLLQMDSGYASIEAPSRGPEDLRLFSSSSSITGSPKDRTAHEKRHHFTNAGRTGTIGESFESHLFEEEPEDELLLGANGGDSVEKSASALSWLPYGQMLTRQESVKPPPQPITLHRRDYSIDEKTDALFHEYLRHDPQFDLQESPRKHRSHIHLRKQWQHHKQWSDPGVRHFQSSFERHRIPLRRGESVNYPLDTSYHSTLPRIVSAPDEETSDGTGSTPDNPKVEPMPAESAGKDKKLTFTDSEDHTYSSLPTLQPSISEKDGGLAEQLNTQEDSKQCRHPPEPPDERSPSHPTDSSGYGPQTITAELTDKLTANLDERLYTALRQTKDTAAECTTMMATHASPDHSPV